MRTFDDMIYFRTVKYEDIKKVFEMEQASGRPTSAPTNKTRPGWHTFTQFDPENNTNRTNGWTYCHEQVPPLCM